jgi:UDP-glucose:glycoprotein glucosyltransferase
MQIADDGSSAGSESIAKVDSAVASGTLAGLDFDVLNARYADHVVQLKELADALQGDAVEDLQQEVKVWAIRELGLQAVQAAHSSSQPLNTLRELAHNLPSRASALSRTVVSQEIRSAVASVQQM